MHRAERPHAANPAPVHDHGRGRPVAGPGQVLEAAAPAIASDISEAAGYRLGLTDLGATQVEVSEPAAAGSRGLASRLRRWAAIRSS